MLVIIMETVVLLGAVTSTDCSSREPAVGSNIVENNCL
ncbi:rCG48451 [Rattus norvegicus]|uniref:RCG48451 n=1 Tax=Rattus norvegicus TaxID=10116 RepID=A6I0B8_RAT|nr:rCG48451 [Rattus norvegicus]